MRFDSASRLRRHTNELGRSRAPGVWHAECPLAAAVCDVWRIEADCGL